MSGRILASSGRVGGAGIWALLILLVLIALLLAVTALQRPESDESAPPFALDSASPTGLLALVRWLEALDYRVERMDAQQSMQMPAGTVLFRYPQPSSYSTDDAAALKNWVAAGGTLVLVGPAVEEAALADAFGVRMTPGALLTDMRRQVQPLLPEGSASYWPSLQFDAQVLDLSGAPAAVAVLADDYGQPVLAVQKIGAGTVWHIVPGIAFSNDGLRQNRQGELLPALLRTAPPGSTVVFDCQPPVRFWRRSADRHLAGLALPDAGWLGDAARRGGRRRVSTFAGPPPGAAAGDDRGAPAARGCGACAGAGRAGATFAVDAGVGGVSTAAAEAWAGAASACQRRSARRGICGSYAPRHARPGAGDAGAGRETSWPSCTPHSMSAGWWRWRHRSTTSCGKRACRRLGDRNRPRIWRMRQIIAE
jgi:hypothetical protein